MDEIENRGQFVATPLLFSMEMACYHHISVFVMISYLNLMIGVSLLVDGKVVGGCSSEEGQREGNECGL